MRSNNTLTRCYRSAVLLAILLAPASAPASAATLFVTSERDNTVTVLDSKTMTIEKVIPVGTRPRGIAITPDHREIFVCIGDDDRLDVIDTKTRTVLRSIPDVLDPELVAIDPAGTRVYAANEEDSQVTVIDRASGKIVGTVGVGAEPEGLEHRPRPFHRGEYVRTDEHGAFYQHQDAHDRGQCSRRPTPARGAIYARRQTSLGVRRGWRHRFGDRRTETHDHNEDQFRYSRRSAGADPAGRHCLLQGRKLAFVALSHANRIAVVDTATLAPTSYILVGERPWHMALDPDGSKLYVANGNTNDLTVIDVATLKAVDPSMSAICRGASSQCRKPAAYGSRIW